MVLVNEVAENVSPTDVFGASYRWAEERRVRGSQIESAMGTVGVLVLYVGVKTRSRCRRPRTSVQSRSSARTVLTHRSAKALAFGDRTGEAFEDSLSASTGSDRS